MTESVTVSPGFASRGATVVVRVASLGRAAARAVLLGGLRIGRAEGRREDDREGQQAGDDPADEAVGTHGNGSPTQREPPRRPVDLGPRGD